VARRPRGVEDADAKRARSLLRLGRVGGTQSRIAAATQRQRGIVTRDELVVGAFGDKVPGAHERLELREGRVHLPGHGALLGLLLDDLGSQLLEFAQHRNRKLKQLDLPLNSVLSRSSAIAFFRWKSVRP